MAINISIATTPRQDAKLALYLARTNTLRVSSGLPAYATISDLLKDYVIETAKSLVKSPDTEDAVKVENAYIDANDSTQAQVKSLLGIP